MKKNMIFVCENEWVREEGAYFSGKDKRGETVKEVRRSDLFTVRESVQRMKYMIKAFQDQSLRVLVFLQIMLRQKHSDWCDSLRVCMWVARTHTHSRVAVVRVERATCGS